jgi:adenine-specific DNA-methyltransferase
MMYPRLFLARNLLREDGFIMVSIDDNEFHNLRAIMNEIYGEENFVASMVWQGGRKNDSKLVSSGHDYILIYARNLALITSEDLRWKERKQGLDEIYAAVKEIRAAVCGDVAEAHRRLMAWFQGLPDGHPSADHDHYNYIDDRGVYYGDNISSPNLRENLIYEFRGYQPPANGWRYEVATMERLYAEGRLILPEDVTRRITVKRYLHETEAWAPSSVFYRDRRGARKVVEDLLGVSAKGLFDFPKDHGVLGRLIATTTSDDDLIVDFFAGSGSTAQAVMAENAKDGSARRFLLVQLPEPTGIEDFPTISGITRARVTAAGESVASTPRTLDVPTVDTGFRAYVLCASNFSVWNSETVATEQVATQLSLAVEHVSEDGDEVSILTELLLKAGYSLTAPTELLRMADVNVYSVSAGALLVCLSDFLTIDVFEAMVEEDPAMILVLDAGFGGNDELKVNALQTVRARNQRTGSDIVLRVV